MFSDIIEVIEMSLLFINNGLEELHADAVTVFTAYQHELIVDIDSIVLESRH